MYYAGSYTKEELEVLAANNCPIMQNWSTVDPNDPIWKKLKTGEIKDIIFDSGGYQMQTGTVTRRVVNVESYALWVELTLRKYPNIKYLCLDIRGDNAATMNYLFELESHGLHPIPIWHPKDSLIPDPYLDYYCEHYDYIAVGGIATGGRETVYKLFEYIMQRHPTTKFHLLGIGTSISAVCRIYRPFSADASSWLSPARWGMELYFNGKDLKTRDMTPEDKLAIRKNNVVRTEWSKKTIAEIRKFENYINSTPPSDPFQMNFFSDK